MTSTLQSEALEQVRKRRARAILGHSTGCLCVECENAEAAALLRARAEEVRSLGLYHREAELRAAADALERHEAS